VDGGAGSEDRGDMWEGASLDGSDTRALHGDRGRWEGEENE
jgi:hypothetical protein